MAKILLVDDNMLSCEVMGDVLHTWGYEVYKLSVGTGVFEFVLKYKPDIILLDIMLPGMNGFEICKKLKGNWDTFQIPVIMLTVLDDVEDRIRAFDVGADAFVTKPVNYSELRSIVTALLRRKERCRYFEDGKSVIASFLQLIKLCDKELYEHVMVVADYCGKVAAVLNLSREQIELLMAGAYLHDIGKIVEKGDEHTRKGIEIIRPLNLLDKMYTFVYSHHERMNGKGFPEEITGVNFSLELKILTLVDEYVNLQEQLKNKDKALNVLDRKVAEGAFDEVVYRALCQVLEDEDFRKNLGMT